MRISVLAGGIGAAKFVEGIVHAQDPGNIDVIVNVGDDSSMFGLHVSPDIDIIMYTLAGIVNPVTRWGIKDDSFNTLGMLKQYYHDDQTWFNIGDKDFATHVFRTHLLGKGKSLTTATAKIAEKLGIAVNVIPCTDDSLKTIIKTREGSLLEFEEYFVRERILPVVKEIIFDGASETSASTAAIAALKAAGKIIIAPSNPYLSIDPILAIREIKELLEERKEVITFISPIVGGAAIKGPTAKIMKELGLVPGCVEIARHYRDVASTAIIDTADAHHEDEIRDLGFSVRVTNTIMDSLDVKVSLANLAISQ